jgi:[ribosomal protein S18]-alanine N-acetyltransferase
MEMVDLIARHHALSFAEPWSADAFSRMLSIPGTYGFVAAFEQTTVGFILARIAGVEAEILTVAVDPPQRGKTIGQQLLWKALAAARERGVHEIFLEVAEDNDAAVKLYKRAGFAQVGRRPGYYKEAGRITDALTLRRAL